MNYRNRAGGMLDKAKILEFAHSKLSPTVVPTETNEAIGAMFLGPKGENTALLRSLLTTIANSHESARKNCFVDDPDWLGDDIKESSDYQSKKADLEKCLVELLKELEKSVPFYSYRYQGHMLWDVTLPGIVGYFAAMLYNQNNVAAEASPVTTEYEIKATRDLCEMLGYNVPKAITHDGVHQQRVHDASLISWGHITCGGSVANIESLWAARNLKYFPVAFAQVLRNDPTFSGARKFTTRLTTGETKQVLDLDNWQLLNLPITEVLSFADRLIHHYGISRNAFTKAMGLYSVQSIGLAAFHRKFLGEMEYPCMLGPSTMHYSWLKGASLLGLGSQHTIAVRVDLDGRMSVIKLREQLESCLEVHRPVAMVVCVLGTTEEGAVDPIAEVIELREEFRRRGLEFVVHVDAAWGGYFKSMFVPAKAEVGSPEKASDKARSNGKAPAFTPRKALSHYVRRQYEALGLSDSITIDPHKGGFVPYPAGALCYRNAAMRDLVSFAAPVIYHGQVDPTIGIFGVEGSKPGAAAAAVYLSHRVISLDVQGYGAILGKTIFNSTKLYSCIATLDLYPRQKNASSSTKIPKRRKAFVVAPFQRLPAEKIGGDAGDLEMQRTFIFEKIACATIQELISEVENETETGRLFSEIGSDQNIVAYAFNFAIPTIIKEHGGETVRWQINADPERLNRFNDLLFNRMSILDPKRHVHRENQTATTSQCIELIITSSKFDPEVYGGALVNSFGRRLGLMAEISSPINFLISTTANPWLTDTTKGDMIPKLIDILERIVLEEIEVMWRSIGLDEATIVQAKSCDEWPSP